MKFQVRDFPFIKNQPLKIVNISFNNLLHNFTMLIFQEQKIARLVVQS